MKKIFSLCLSTVCFGLSSFALTQAEEQSEPPAWYMLPEQTVAVFRMPSLTATFDEAMNSTETGQVLASFPVFDLAAEFIQLNSNDETDRVRDFCEHYNLSVDDLRLLFDGDIGCAVLINAGDDPSESASFLLWLQPDPALAERLDAALLGCADIIVEETTETTSADTEEEFSSTEHWHRTDSILAGVDVHTLGSTEGGGIAWAWQGGRLIFSYSPNQEHVESSLERFVSALQVPEMGSFAQGIQDLPHYQTALVDDGRLVYELLVNPELLIEQLDKQVQRNVSADVNDPSRSLFDFADLEKIGPFFMRAASNGHESRTFGFWDMPAPRTGFFRLFDQQEVRQTVPTWVPERATQYAHISFSLESLYEVVRNVASLTGNDEHLDTFEMQVRGVAQVDFPSILEAFGHKHTLVALPEIVEAAESTEAAVSFKMPRQAVIWEVDNEEVWTKLLQLVGMAQAAPFGQNLVYENDTLGFQGWRMSGADMPVELGLYYGNGYASLIMGPARTGTVNEMLAILSKNTAGEQTLVQSEAYQRLSGTFSRQDGIAYAYSDAQSDFKIITNSLDDWADSAEGQEADFVERFKEAWPFTGDKDWHIPRHVSAYTTAEGVVIEGYEWIP